MTRLSLLVLLLLLPASTWAQDNTTGNSMLTVCKDVATNPQSIGAAFCLGEASALRNVSNHLDERMRSCVPQTVTDGQAVRVIVKRMEDFPETLHKNFLVLALAALRSTWPCE